LQTLFLTRINLETLENRILYSAKTTLDAAASTSRDARDAAASRTRNDPGAVSRSRNARDAELEAAPGALRLLEAADDSDDFNDNKSSVDGVKTTPIYYR
jgi:hypothetical protein